MPSHLYRVLLRGVCQKVQHGITLSSAIPKQMRLPHLFLQLLVLGETTGHFTNLMEHAAHIMTQHLQEKLALLTNLLEPVLMALMGGIIGTIVIAMYLPVFSMGSML